MNNRRVCAQKIGENAETPTPEVTYEEQ